MITEQRSASAGASGLVFSRYSENNCPNQRADWLLRVEDRTEPFRRERAAEHRGRARYAHLVGRLGSVQWHRPRANGQLERFARVYDCGQKELLLHCQGCGAEVARRLARCGHRRVCLCCRTEYARRQQARFRPARATALERASGMLWNGAPAGHWGERFLTLTTPHSGNVEADIQMLPRAWKVFRRLLWEHFRLDRRLAKNIFAGIYRGLEKVRAIVTSRNFWPKGDAGRHCECGCTLTRTQIVRPETEPRGGSESA